MKANELRIGNYLKRDTVVKIDARSIFDIWEETKEYQPIPLTEEWLLKFGLVNGVFPDIEYFSVEGLNSMPESYGLYYENDWTAVSIEYVHQLQNLYFALTGQELEVK